MKHLTPSTSDIHFARYLQKTSIFGPHSAGMSFIQPVITAVHGGTPLLVAKTDEPQFEQNDRLRILPLSGPLSSKDLTMSSPDVTRNCCDPR